MLIKLDVFGSWDQKPKKMGAATVVDDESQPNW